MELFSLLAKLTLDKSDFDKELDSAEKEANSFDMPDNLSLDLDTQDFSDGVADAEEKGQGFATNVSSAFEGIKGALIATGVVGAITGVVSALKEAVSLTAETADAIDKGSRRLGISSKSYQEWDHALRQSGASITDLQKGVLQFNNYLSGDKTEDMANAFKQLGVEADKAGMTTEQLINDTLIALADFDGSTEERGRLVTALFGRGGMSLNALLDSGKKGVEDLLNEADDLGLVMSQEEIDQAVAYGDAMANLQSEIEAVKTAFTRNIMPFLTSAVTTLTKVVALFNPRAGKTTLTEKIEEIDAALSNNVQTLETNESKANALLDKLIELGDYNNLDAKGKKTWDQVAKELIELFPQLDGVIDTDTHTISTNTDSIRDNIAEWAKLEEQRLMDENLAQKRQAVAEQYAAALDKEVEAELKEVDANAKRQEAVDQLNEAMKTNEELRMAVNGFVGEEGITDENIGDLFTFLHEKGFETVGTEAIDEWNKLNSEAQNLRSEAENMYKEADDAQINLRKYAEALAKKLGITLTDTEKVNLALREMTDLMSHFPGTVRVELTEKRYTHAIGSEYIPFDNYPALLHRGEKVLTATEARNQEKGSNLDFGALQKSITEAVKAGMDNATVRSFLNGKDITDEVSAEMAKQLAARRFA